MLQKAIPQLATSVGATAPHNPNFVRPSEQQQSGAQQKATVPGVQHTMRAQRYRGHEYTYAKTDDCSEDPKR